MRKERLTARLTRKPTARADRPSRMRRGVSLIEVVMASMLVAILSTAVVGGIVTVIAADMKNQQKLEALELGNRLLLQFLDDKAALPSEEEPIVQGLGTYRWHLTRTPVKLEMPPGSIIMPPPADSPGEKTQTKTELLTVTVYSGVAQLGGGFTEGHLLCTLSRLNHPLSLIYRNPDAMARAFSDPARAIEIFTDLIATGEPPAARPAANANASGTSRATGGGGAVGAGPAPKPPAGSTPDPNVRVDDGSTFQGVRGARR